MHLILIVIVGKLTDKNGGQQSGWHTEEDDEYISDGQINDEIIGDGAHPRSSKNNCHDETVTNEPNDEHRQIGQTVKARDYGRVSIEEVRLISCIVVIVTLVILRRPRVQLVPVIRLQHFIPHVIHD